MTSGGLAARAGRAVENFTSISSHTSPVRCHAVAIVTSSSGASLPCGGTGAARRTTCSGRQSAQGTR
ncbi:MAG: hypothetical protein QM820_14130 [Minicystis sp.]